MAVLSKKIDFMVVLSATNANPNGDPLNENRPRTDSNGYGEISTVCIKRKIRNRMQDLGNQIFVKADDRCDDGFKTLKERANDLAKIKDVDEYAEEACKRWLDVRTFGSVFAFNGLACKSCGVRGPVSVHIATSVDPVDIESMQITKSTSGDKADEASRGRDTMGFNHLVRFGLYVVKGSINVQLAEKTGFTDDDAEIVKQCLKTLFLNDASAARPDGSMQVVKLYWWKHNCKDGQYSPAKVHHSVVIKKKDGVVNPMSIDDYEIERIALDGLECEEYDGE